MEIRRCTREESNEKVLVRWSALWSLLFTTRAPCLSRYRASQKRSWSPYALGDTVRHNGARINRITGGMVAQPSFPHCYPRMHVSTHECKRARARTSPASGDAIALTICRLADLRRRLLRCRATLIIYARAQELWRFVGHIT